MSKYERKPNQGAAVSEHTVSFHLNDEEHSLLRAASESENKAASVLGRRALMREVRRVLVRRGLLPASIERARKSAQRRGKKMAEAAPGSLQNGDPKTSND